MRVVSFSIFGSEDMYWDGALANALLVRKHMPGWTPVLHYSITEAPRNYDKRILDVGAVGAPMNRDRNGAAYPNNKFWRLLPAMDPRVDRYVMRDADSRVGPRDAEAVQAWERSKIPFHKMHDHPLHFASVMAGMWGGVKGALPRLKEDCKRWFDLCFTSGKIIKLYGNDQAFLQWAVLPYMKRDGVFTHASPCVAKRVPGSLPFPSEPTDDSFIGEIIDADGKPVHPQHREMRKKAL